VKKNPLMFGSSKGNN